MRNMNEPYVGMTVIVDATDEWLATFGERERRVWLEKCDGKVGTITKVYPWWTNEKWVDVLVDWGDEETNLDLGDMWTYGRTVREHKNVNMFKAVRNE